MQSWKGSRGEWYVVAQFGLFMLIAFGPKQLFGMPTWEVPWATVTLIIGLGIGVFGATLIMFGVANLGTNLSPLPHPKMDSQLVETGAYRIVRHPIYAGIIVSALGWALISASSARILYALLLFIFFDLKSRREERWLVERFPTYSAYQRRVRKLIPFLY